MTLGIVAAGLIAADPAQAADHAYELDSSNLRIGFGDDGSIQSLKVADDAFDTEYVMNPESAPDQAAEAAEEYKQWLGNIMFSYSTGEGSVSVDGVGDEAWKSAWTTRSADARTVTGDDDSVTVRYENSAADGGIRDFAVDETYRIAPDGSLTWTQTATNVSDAPSTPPCSASQQHLW